MTESVGSEKPRDGRPDSSWRRGAHWFRALAWRWLVIILASLGSLVLFAKVGEDVTHNESRVFDDAVRGWMLRHQTRSLYDAFFLITTIGSTPAMVALALALGAWLWWRGHRRIAAAVVTAPALASGIFVAVKELVRRIRPVGALKLHVLTYAFPSGHATTSAAVLAIVAYVLWRERFVQRPLALTVGVGGPLLIGVSRVYLDVHWTTDVLGGWALGMFVATLSAALYERFRARIVRDLRRS